MSIDYFYNDVQIQKQVPALQYAGQEGSPQYYCEDREIDGAMYRALNASYDYTLTQWSQQNPDLPSYCTVHYTDGSIQYFYMPAGQSMGWSDWQSTDIQEFYAVNYGLVEGMTADPVANLSALNAAVAAAIANGGGAVRLPAGDFPIEGTISVNFGMADVAVVIAGFSGQTRLYQTTSDDIFYVSDSSGGSFTVIQDLRLKFAPMTLGTTPAAVNISGCEGVVCEHIYFEDCPIALKTDGNCGQCGLFECTIDYDLKNLEGETINGQTMVYLNGSDDFITGCVIRQQPVGGESAGPLNCTGVALGSNNNGQFVTDTHISDFAFGMTIGDGLNEVYCSDVLIEAQQTALIIKTLEGAAITDIHFTGCTFSATRGGGYAGNTSGVIISANGYESIKVAGIYFTNCSVFGFAYSGIEIDSGQNIVITGGQYSSNGQSPGTEEPYNAAGIAILGGSDITISGADCSGVNGFWSQVTGATTQQYGICIAGGDASDVLVVGCNLTGNATSGLYLLELSGTTPGHVYIRDCDATGYTGGWSVALDIASTAQIVHVTNCAGYNDQSPAFIPVPASGPPAGPFHNYTYGYFGPVSFYVGAATGTSVLIGSHATLLGMGAYYLPLT